MMTDIIRSGVAEVLPAEDLSALSISELRDQLADALTATARGLQRAAAIWRELQERGEPMMELRSGLALWLPRIAADELAAEAVIAFAGQRMLLQRLVGMPLDQQRRLAAGEAIGVAVVNDHGEIIGEPKPLAKLSSREVLLAIDHGEIRPLQAQIRTLSPRRSRRRRPKSGHTTATIRPDREHGLLIVGRARLDPGDLDEALRALGFRLVRIGADPLLAAVLQRAENAARERDPHADDAAMRAAGIDPAA